MTLKEVESEFAKAGHIISLGGESKEEKELKAKWP